VKHLAPLLSLKPTQFALGMRQINAKIEQLAKLKKRKLDALVDECPIPVIVSPKRELYLIDRHHHLYAFWSVGITNVRVEVRADLSKSRLSYTNFWKTMQRSGWTHLFDQFGEGPRPVVYLPVDIRGLADDPYRSLAWAVKQKGGIGDSTVPYYEFAWANFFRAKHLLHADGRAGFTKAVMAAMKLTRSRAAKVSDRVRPR